MLQGSYQILKRTVFDNPYIPQLPTPKQALFLQDMRREVFYGGAAGGAKSSALLMAALQFVDDPTYAALLFRRTYGELALPGGLMDRAHDWLQRTDARWRETDKTWTFPSGAKLVFGYLQHSTDKYRYQGSDYRFVGFDELTQFPEADYLYMQSRTRRLSGTRIPIRIRGASNPGNIGHEWVYQRFMTSRRTDRSFIPALLQDNPHLDREDYERTLSELDPITRAQLLEGRWVRDTSAQPFRREWFTRRNRYTPGDTDLMRKTVARYISWDTAFKDKDDSAYTAAVVVELTADYRLAVVEVWRAKLQFPDLIPAMEAVTERHNRDGKLRGIIVEDRASGVSALQTLAAAGTSATADMLVPFEPKGSKVERAQQAAVWAKLDTIMLPSPSGAVPWLADFEAELFTFPLGADKDQVDAFDQIVLYLEHMLAAGHHAREQAEGEIA
ncbi:MAG: terminase large subunit domain-containing protein [Burkholderiaceae bacterium]